MHMVHMVHKAKRPPVVCKRFMAVVTKRAPNAPGRGHAHHTGFGRQAI